MGLREFVSDPRFQSKDEATKRAMLLEYGVAPPDLPTLLAFKPAPPIPEEKTPTWDERFMSRNPGGLAGATQIPGAVSDLAGAGLNAIPEIAKGIGTTVGEFLGQNLDVKGNYEKLRERGQTPVYSALGSIPFVGPAADVVTQDIYHGRGPEMVADAINMAPILAGAGSKVAIAPVGKEALAILKDAAGSRPGFLPKTAGEMGALALANAVGGPPAAKLTYAFIKVPKILEAVAKGRAERKAISVAKAQGELLKMKNDAIRKEVFSQKTPEAVAIQKQILTAEAPKAKAPEPKPKATTPEAVYQEILDSVKGKDPIYAGMILKQQGVPEYLHESILKNASAVPEPPAEFTQADIAMPEAPPHSRMAAMSPEQPPTAPELPQELPAWTPPPVEPAVASEAPKAVPDGYVPPVDPIMNPQKPSSGPTLEPVYSKIRDDPGYQALVAKVKGMSTPEAIKALIDVEMPDWLIAPTIEASGGARPSPLMVKSAVNAAKDAAYDARVAALPKGDVVTAPPAFPGQQRAPFVKGATIPGAEDRLSYLQRTAKERGEAPAEVKRKIAANKTKGVEVKAALESPEATQPIAKPPAEAAAGNIGGLSDFHVKHLQDWLEKYVPEQARFDTYSRIVDTVREDPTVLDKMSWADIDKRAQYVKQNSADLKAYLDKKNKTTASPPAEALKKLKKPRNKK